MSYGKPPCGGLPLDAWSRRYNQGDDRGGVRVRFPPLVPKGLEMLCEQSQPLLQNSLILSFQSPYSDHTVVLDLIPCLAASAHRTAAGIGSKLLLVKAVAEAVVGLEPGDHLLHDGVPRGCGESVCLVGWVAILGDVLRTFRESPKGHAVLVLLEVAESLRQEAAQVVIKTPCVAVTPATDATLDEPADGVVGVFGELADVLDPTANSPVGGRVPRVGVVVEKVGVPRHSTSDAVGNRDRAIAEEEINLPPDRYSHVRNLL